MNPVITVMLVLIVVCLLLVGVFIVSTVRMRHVDRIAEQERVRLGWRAGPEQP